ncbi:MAG: hypothetical protein KAV83_01740 [Desulfobacterales bacterium]|nr:hypothetical protein [Desulfobacterales bacterium]
MLRPDPFQIEVLGEELAKLNAMPLDDRRAYVAQRQQSFNTPHDLVQKAGFPTEYWENMEEIPEELLDIQQRAERFSREEAPRLNTDKDILLNYQGHKYIIETKINRSHGARTLDKAIEQVSGKYLSTEQAHEGYIVIFDLKTMVGELCTPQKHIVEGKEILSFNIGIGRR